jgi:hypothetical protein
MCGTIGQQKSPAGEPRLRRQTKGGGPTSAGSSRVSRLDPFSLPVRFCTGDNGADEQTRDVELHREHVVLRRRVRGIPTAVDLPVAAFLGVALRAIEPKDEAASAVCLTLEHPDPKLSIPLFASPDSDEVVAEWQSWSQVLRRPLLIVDDGGGLHELFSHLGQVRVGAPVQRRRRRTAMKGRRPSIRWRRRCGMASAEPRVHRSEREIIARD